MDEAEAHAEQRRLAQFRLTWLDSEERAALRRGLRRLYWSIGAAFVGTAVLWILVKPAADPNASRDLYTLSVDLLTGGVAGSAFTAYLGAYLLLLYRTRLRRQLRDKLLVEPVAARMNRADEAIAAGDTDFGSLWNATQKRLDYYHEIATAQSRASFFYSQIAAGSGFVVILIAAIAASFADTSTSAIVAGLIGISGGGLGAYVGSTFMKSQETTSAQMREYFAQPLELSKILAAERLIQQLNETEKPPAVQQVIAGIMRQQVRDDGQGAH